MKLVLGSGKEPETGHSPPFNAEVRKTWRYIATPQHEFTALSLNI
jgi:hypothetical protein